MKAIIIEVLEKLQHSNYVDPSEHLYDAIKDVKRYLDDDNLHEHIHDFLWGLESSTVIDVDGVVEECSALIRKHM